MNVVGVVALALVLAQGQTEAGTAEAQQPQQQPPPEQQPAQPQQQPPPEAAGLPVLTLEDALATAAKENLDLRALEARLDQVETISRQAWARQLPQITASGRYTRNEVEASITLPTGYYVRDFGSPQGPAAGADPDVPGSPTPYGIVPSDFVEATIQELNQLNAQVEASQVLFAPGLWQAIRNAHRTERIANVNAAGVRRDVLFIVAQAYYGAAALKQQVAVTERLLEVAQRQERDARVRYQAGTIAKVGLLRAEIDRARAEQDLRRSRNGFDSARLTVAALLHRDAGFDVVPPPEPKLEGDVAAYEEAALRHRTDVQAATLEIDQARGERRVVAADYLPVVAAFGLYQWANTGGFTGQNDTWAAGVSLSWNIFDGGLREAQLSSASARITETELVRENTISNARRIVRQAWLDWESAVANAAKAKEQRELAAENLRLVDVSYRAGAATAVELADATAQLRTAELGFTAESLQAQLAALAVLRAAGEFEPVRRK